VLTAHPAGAGRPCHTLGLARPTEQLIPTHKNQKAHEVTRDVTAWAGWVILRPKASDDPSLVSDRFSWQVAPGPGPASVLSARSLSCDALRTDGLAPTVLSASLTQQGGVAVSRLDGRGVSLSVQPNLAVCVRRAMRTSPDVLSRATGLIRPGFQTPAPGPVPRIARPSHARYQAAAASWVRRFACRGTLFPRCEPPRAATLTRLA
jgi:hypothetical protein